MPGFANTSTLCATYNPILQLIKLKYSYTLSVVEWHIRRVFRNILVTTIAVSSLITISCNSRHSEKTNEHAILLPASVKSRLDCLDGRDTAFSNEDYLKHVLIGDTAFDLKVRIDGKETRLGYHFTCGMPKGLIPTVLKHSASQLILVRGFGFHFREVIVCRSSAGNIIVTRFETELAVGAGYDIAYPDNDDPSKIIVTNLLTKKNIVLALGQKVDSIKIFQISKERLVVVMNNSRELAIPFQR
ncbi:MAG: hypothetical protein EOP48_17915 [Sphingobacteriales bacterium]|nr:MAG: hypothetical protein EOP48_17915 [Sphingobacteriales bacterium]